MRELVQSWGMTISDSVLEEHIKFINLCYEFVGAHADFETFLTAKGYILRNKIRSGYEGHEYSKKELREGIVSGELLLGAIYDQKDVPEYSIIATKAGFQKVKRWIKDTFGPLLEPKPIT